MQEIPADKTSSVAALDRGVGFAIAHKGLLLFLCLIPAVFEASAAYFQYASPLSQQQLFLVILLTLASKAWLLSVVLIACVTYFRGEELTLLNLSKKALRYLPKIFLSYAALLSLVLCSALVLPLVFLVLFLVWAPAFCVGELFVPQEEKAEDVDEEAMDEDYFAKSRQPSTQLSFFKNKSIFELGFARSLQFGVKHAVLTFQVAILIWFANVLPSALIDVLSGSYYGFVSTMAKIVLSSYGDVLATAVAGSAFIMLLPGEAKTEIGVSSESRLPRIPQFARLEGRSWIFFVLSLAAAGSTYVVLRHALLAEEMPQGVLTEVRKAEKFNEQFVVELHLSDSQRKFRWLNPLSVTLSFDKDLRGALPSNDAETPEETTTFRQATRVLALDTQGQELDINHLTPSYKPIVLKLYYSLPKDIEERGTYRLRYESYLNKPKMLAQGSFGSW